MSTHNDAAKPRGGHGATLAFADAILREVNGAPLNEEHRRILANDPRLSDKPQCPDIEEPSCSYCC